MIEPESLPPHPVGAILRPLVCCRQTNDGIWHQAAEIPLLPYPFLPIRDELCGSGVPRLLAQYRKNLQVRKYSADYIACQKKDGRSIHDEVLVAALSALGNLKMPGRDKRGSISAQNREFPGGTPSDPGNFGTHRREKFSNGRHG